MLRRLLAALWDLRPWSSHSAPEYREAMEQPSALSLDQAFEECPGKWVAVDRRTSEVVAVESSPYQLSALIKQRGLQHVAIVRIPSEDQPELVGLG